MVDDALSGRRQNITPANPKNDVIVIEKPENNVIAAEKPKNDAIIWDIPWEFFAYALVALVVFILRFAELDTVPPRVGEIPDMLAAWRGQPLNSPLVFWAQRLSFDVMGGTIFAGRLLTALVSMGVVFAPILFRDELGRGRSFLFTLLLATLPPLFIASRTAEGVVWTLFVAAITARLILTALQTNEKGHWTAAIASLVALLLLTEPGGVILAALLIFSMVTALIWDDADQEQNEPLDEDDTEPDIKVSAWAKVRGQIRNLPWETGLAFGGLITVAVSTLLINFSGLSSVGGLLNGIVKLFSTGTPDNLVAVVLFYLPWTLILAIGGVWVANHEGWTLTNRFFTLWTVWALFVAVFLPGLTNAHAVFLAVPLCGLATGALANAFKDDRRRALWAEAESEAGDDLAALYRPVTGRWILGVLVLALLMLTSVHIQTISREVLQVLDGSVSGFFARLQSPNVFVDVRIGLLWAFIGGMFLLIGFFLAAGIWGNRTTLQGYALGVLVFLTLTQISAGWYTSVFNADNPTEAWDSPATGLGYRQMTKTLHDFMQREAYGFSLLPITVVRDPSTGATEDGLLGWMLKDQRVTFVDTLTEARAKPFVMVSNALLESNTVPDLGGSYVGQRFVLTKAWSPNTLLGADVLTWWLQRQTRSQPYPVQTVTLWVRQDVFEGVPIGDLLLTP
jgi:hypothetical protein